MYQEQANGIGAGMLAGKVYGNTIPDTPPTPGFMAVLENLGGTEACVRLTDLRDDLNAINAALP